MTDAMKLTDLQAVLGGPIDVFICSASFEARCRSIAECVKVDQWLHVLICSNRNLSEHIRPNELWLRSHFGRKANIVRLNTENPIATADNLSEAVNAVRERSAQRIVVDITTFTHESLLILLRLLLLQLGDRDELLFVYATAEDYSVNTSENEKWLSRGIGSIRSVLGYPGESVPSQQSHLVVLVGFEHERAGQLINLLEPSVVSLGYGAEDDSISNRLHSVNVRFLDQVKILHENVQTFTFSCTNAELSKQAILAQAALFPDHNVLIAPMNTKISTIGAGLAAIDNPSYQLCYAPASQYNFDGYSSPGDSCFLFRLETSST